MKKLLFLLFLIPSLAVAEDWNSYCNFMADFHNTFKVSIDKKMGGGLPIKNYSCNTTQKTLVAKHQLAEKYNNAAKSKNWRKEFDMHARLRMGRHFCSLARAHSMSSEEKDIYAAQFFTNQQSALGMKMSVTMRQMLDVDLSNSFFQVIIEDKDGRKLSNFKNSFNDCKD